MNYLFLNQKGDVVLDLKDIYDWVGNFNEGLCPVSKDDLMGFININGTLIIPMKYELDQFSIFSNGLAPVKTNSKVGFIDSKGNVIIDFMFDDAYRFFDGIAPAMKNDNWGYIDTSGNIIVDLEFDNIKIPNQKHGIVSKGGKEFIMNIDTSELTSKGYDVLGGLSENLSSALFSSSIWGKKKYGFINNHGEVVVKSKYDMCGAFSESKAVVELNGKYGFINKDGEEVIPLKYDSAWKFSAGLAVVRLDNKEFMIDENNVVVIDNDYDELGSMKDGFSFFKKNGKIGYINRSGHQIVPNLYDVCPQIDLIDQLEITARYFSEGYVLVNKGHGHGETSDDDAQINWELDLNWEEIDKL